MAINQQDEKDLRKLVREMNIGFAAPQNGGVDKASVMILGMDETPKEAGGDEDVHDLNVPQLLQAVIENINHLKMDIDQGCQGDAQIEELQKCVDMLNSVIQEIGNTTSGKDQNAAFTGIGGETIDGGNDSTSQMDMNAMAQLPQ